MVDHVECQIDIQIGPMHMIRAESLNLGYLPDSGVGKPWESVEWHVVFMFDGLTDSEPTAGLHRLGALSARQAS